MVLKLNFVCLNFFLKFRIFQLICVFENLEKKFWRLYFINLHFNIFCFFRMLMSNSM